MSHCRATFRGLEKARVVEITRGIRVFCEGGILSYVEKLELRGIVKIEFLSQFGTKWYWGKLNSRGGCW